MVTPVVDCLTGQQRVPKDRRIRHDIAGEVFGPHERHIQTGPPSHPGDFGVIRGDHRPVDPWQSRHHPADPGDQRHTVQGPDIFQFDAFAAAPGGDDHQYASVADHMLSLITCMCKWRWACFSAQRSQRKSFVKAANYKSL